MKKEKTGAGKFTNNNISTDRETVKSIMKLAVEHNVSINEENRGFEPATLVWDGGAGC